MIVLLLSMSLYYYIRKSTHISDNEKEFINFTIDMYVKYAEELDIHSKKQHEKIVSELEKIKNKHFKVK